MSFVDVATEMIPSRRSLQGIAPKPPHQTRRAIAPFKAACSCCSTFFISWRELCQAACQVLFHAGCSAKTRGGFGDKDHLLISSIYLPTCASGSREVLVGSHATNEQAGGIRYFLLPLAPPLLNEIDIWRTLLNVLINRLAKNAMDVLLKKNGYQD